jgi:hypothetical protein
MVAEWQFAVVAFIDVLGFAALVEEDARSTDPKHLHRLVACLAEARESTPAGKLDVRSFSDSIIISAPLVAVGLADVVSSVVGLQRIFARNRVLIRGAIAYGKHFSDRDSVYSEALVRAYKLERGHARFPRVIIDPDLLDWFMNESCAGDGLKKVVVDAILLDRDARAFVNYLDATSLKGHLELIRSYDLVRLSASVLEKLQWLAAYHNFVARPVDPSALVSGPLAQGFRALVQ